MKGLCVRRKIKPLVLILFDASGGSASANSMKTGSNGKLASLPTATRESHTFAGWFRSDGTQVTTDTVFTEDETVYARWQAQTVTVTITQLSDVSTNGDPLSYVQYDGTLYKTVTSFSAKKGGVLRCLINSAVFGSSRSNSFIVNGTTVKTRGSTVEDAEGRSCYYYDHTLTKDCSVRANYGGAITITE